MMLALSGASAAPGLASVGAEQQGAQLLQRFRAGDQKCEQLSRAQFEAIGEYVMGRMVGSARRHEAMDRQIRTTAGASGEEQAHVFLGQRFTDCATGAAPAGFGSMMGMMGTFSGAAGAGMGMGRDGADGRDMGGDRQGADGFGPGMTGGSDQRGDGDGWSSTDTVLAILLAAALAALVAARPWRRSSPKTPGDVLSERYARGDIDTADYQQRRDALGGTA